MEIKTLAREMDSIVTNGGIVDAVKQFFEKDAITSDFGGVKTSNKNQMIDKMEGFTAAIAKVNGITHHHTIVDGNLSASEFTFNFIMKDGSEIYWHEIIRRIWNNDGKVIQEEYFNAQ